MSNQDVVGMYWAPTGPCSVLRHFVGKRANRWLEIGGLSISECRLHALVNYFQVADDPLSISKGTHPRLSAFFRQVWPMEPFLELAE